MTGGDTAQCSSSTRDPKAVRSVPRQGWSRGRLRWQQGSPLMQLLTLMTPWDPRRDDGEQSCHRTVLPGTGAGRSGRLLGWSQCPGAAPSPRHGYFNSAFSSFSAEQRPRQEDGDPELEERGLQEGRCGGAGGRMQKPHTQNHSHGHSCLPPAAGESCTDLTPARTQAWEWPGVLLAPRGDGRWTWTQMQLNFVGSRTAARRDVHCTGTLRNGDAAAAQRAKGAGNLLRGSSEGGPCPCLRRCCIWWVLGQSRCSDMPHPRADSSSTGESTCGNARLFPSASSFEPLHPLNS